MSEFESISPYTDAEAVEALARVAKHPVLPVISKYLFPDKPLGYLSGLIKDVHSIDEFQCDVMLRAIDSVIDKTTHGISVEGIENVKAVDGKCLFISNHRDIVLDPAFLQWILHANGMPMTDICVGSNLLGSQLIEDLMRSNRMIKVIRGISARELYLSSQLLSKYIRQQITSGSASVWIAQKEGRTKNGIDTTEQGLLKMFDMSGEDSFDKNFEALNIVPVSISYEYEPCDARKARELLISRTEKYVKKPNEDLHSILTGIRQRKGHVQFAFGEPLSRDEIEKASQWRGNDRYQAIRQAVDRRVISGYKLWKTNYMAFDLVNSTNLYAKYYTPEDLEDFKAYTQHKLGKLEKSLNRYDLCDIFLHIYSNPVESKRKAGLI